MPPGSIKSATVRVKLPEIITNPERKMRLIREAAREALEVTMTSTLGEIKRGNTVPVGVTGNLVNSLTHTRPVVAGSRVESSFISTGPAAEYSAVMDLGRRPGRRLWHGWLYYQRGQERQSSGWRGGWVNRRMREAVVALAARLQAESGGKGRREKHEKRAAFLLARKVAQNIVTRGIKAHEFFRRYARPGSDQRRLVRRFRADFTKSARRWGLIQ